MRSQREVSVKQTRNSTRQDVKQRMFEKMQHARNVKREDTLRAARSAETRFSDDMRPAIPSETMAMIGVVCEEFGFDFHNEEMINFLLEIEAEIVEEELFRIYEQTVLLDDPELQYQAFLASQK